MFGFNKKKKEEIKKRSGVDKLLMGVILGGAIGSVLGIGLAPKKGSETRKLISKKANELYNEAKDAVSHAAEKVTDKAQQMIENYQEKDQKNEEEPKKLSPRDKVKEIPEEK